MKSGFFKQNGVALLSLVVALAFGSFDLIGKKNIRKIAYAETSVLMSEFSEAIKARKEFEGSQKEWDKNLKLLNDSLMAAMEKMKKEYDQAGKADKEKLRASLQHRNEDLQRYTNAVKKMSEGKEKELMEPVIKKMNSFMDLWGRQHGYDFIFGTMAGGNILQANPQYNVTQAILVDLNSHYKDLPSAGDRPESKASVNLQTTSDTGKSH